MNKTQEAKIKSLTKFTYTEVIEMSDVDFFRNITKIFVSGRITQEQYKWLEGQRLGNVTQSIMKLFDGKYEGKVSNKEISNCLKNT